MTTHTKLTLRLHPDRDADLIRWLASLDGLPFGQKGRAIKETLRRGLGQQPDPESAMNVEALLSDIRAVVESAVQQALASGVTIIPASTAGDTDETDALLDQLGDQLMFSRSRF